jgi:hypothetical protein
MDGLKRCGSCERGPQKLDQFLDKFGRDCLTCIKCRIRTKRNRKPRVYRKCNQCGKQPCFNIPGSNVGVLCNDHKEPGMINVISQTCEYKDCSTQPCFNFSNELFGKFCAKHRKEGMVNLRERPCEHEDCRKKPVFNFADIHRGRFCKEHKQAEMIDVLSIKCQEPGCLLRPAYNVSGVKRPILCSTHKKDGMIDVISKRCLTPMCDIIVNDSSRDHCSRCTAYLFPDRPSNFKTREMKLKEYLIAQYPDKTITHDKSVECHLYRPDFVFDMGSHTIVIELDENQHKSYDTSCDNKRLVSIFQGLGSRPMVLLRFNPDRYETTGGCFRKDGSIVGKGNEWITRTSSLKSRIDHWLAAQPEREITIEHLFFDTSRG